MKPSLLALCLTCTLAACSGGADDDGTGDDGGSAAGLALLGQGSHDVGSVSVQRVMNAADGLDLPTDLAINPRATDELWVVNYGDDSLTVQVGYGTDAASSQTFKGSNAEHFIAKPMGIAFSDFGNFATIHDTDQKTQGANGTPADFMGPTLWDDDLDVFDAGHASHLDMLHDSPLGGGIAWEADNVYWVFDGYHAAISRYDFQDDHGYGGADHSDGEMLRYLEDKVARTEGIPAALEYDHSTDLLYIADTDNSRIVVLDALSGEIGDRVGPNYDGGDQYEVTGSDLTLLVDGLALDGVELTAPAGMVLDSDGQGGGVLYIGDSDAGRILAFDLDGALLDWVDLGLGAGALAGLELDADGNLLYVDMIDQSVWRITP